MLHVVLLASVLAFPAAALVPAPVPAEPLVFEKGCQQGEHITLPAEGDVMGHRNIQKRAIETKDYGRFWRAP